MFLYIKTILVLYLFYENVSGTCLGVNGSTTNIVGAFAVTSGIVNVYLLKNIY